MASSSNQQHEVMPQCKKEMLHTQKSKQQTVCTDLIVNSQKNTKYSKEEIAIFLENMFYFWDVQLPDDNFTKTDVFQEILLDFSERCSIKQDFDGFNLPMMNPPYEARLITQATESIPIMGTASHIVFSEFLNKVKEDTHFS
jgi:23S rRNA G2445 N2-methylase RlmL